MWQLFARSNRRKSRLGVLQTVAIACSVWHDMNNDRKHSKRSQLINLETHLSERPTTTMTAATNTYRRWLKSRNKLKIICYFYRMDTHGKVKGDDASDQKKKRKMKIQRESPRKRKANYASRRNDKFMFTISISCV